MFGALPETTQLTEFQQQIAANSALSQELLSALPAIAASPDLLAGLRAALAFEGATGFKTAANRSVG